jgi:2-polyprenyl-6-methoxyphenol hydroxylase-like FAD-dependent oxidoreductase
MAPLKILIVGCSIAGPTLATFLLLSNLPASDKPHITVLERSSTIRKQGQNIDIRGAGVTIIRKLGLEHVIRASTTGEIGVQLVDAANRVWSSNTADKTGQVSTPTADIEILRGTLADICYRRSQSVSEEVRREGGAGIEYIFGDYLDVLEQDGSQVHVRFANSGKRQGFDVVVGADGLQSGTRILAWGSEGEKDRIKRLGMYSAFFSIPKGATDSEWRRWYHAPGRRWIMARPSDQKDKTTILMSVVNEEDERFVQVASKGREDVGAQKRLMAEYFEDAGWESHRIIQGMMETTDFYYDLVAQVKMDKWSKGRVVLLGDAG